MQTIFLTRTAYDLLIEMAPDFASKLFQDEAVSIKWTLAGVTITAPASSVTKAKMIARA